MTGEFGALGVSGAQLLEVAMELDPEVKDEGPEEGDGRKPPLASDEAAVSSELFNPLRREKLVQGSLHFPPTEGSRSAPGSWHASDPGRVRRGRMKPIGSRGNARAQAEEETVNLCRMETL